MLREPAARDACATSSWHRRIRSRLHDAFGDGVAGQAGGIMDVELVYHLLAMFLDRLDADVQFSGNLLIGLALRDELQNFRLAGGEPVSALLERAAAHKSVAALIQQAF